jgi:hypothetical protein
MALPKEVSTVLFAAWLQENYPDVYAQLAQQVGAGPTQHLNGFTDFLRTAGSAIANTAKTVVSGLSSGVKAVGGYLASSNGMETLSALAQTYSAVNQATLATQYARAQAGEAPATIETRYDPATGQYVPIYAPNAGSGYLVNQNVLSKLSPGFFQKYLWWIVGGVGVLAVILILRKR